MGCGLVVLMKLVSWLTYSSCPLPPRTRRGSRVGWVGGRVGGWAGGWAGGRVGAEIPKQVSWSR